MDVVGLKIITGTITDLVVDACEAAWTSDNGGITCTADSNRKVGSFSAKNISTFAPINGPQLLAHHAVSSANLSTYQAVQLYVYTNVDIPAGKYSLLLDDTAGCVSPLETLPLPDLRGGFWNLFMLNLVNPSLDTAIISVGCQLNAGWVIGGTEALYFDNILAVHGYAFNTLGIRGLGDVDDNRLHPGIRQVLLDGSIQTINSAFGRKISCTLWPIGTTKPMRVWLVVSWILSNGMRVVAQGEEVPVVLVNAAQFNSRFIAGTDLARGYDLAVDEQMTRNTTPDAWL